MRYVVIVFVAFLMGCVRPPEPSVQYVAFVDSQTGGFPDHLIGLLGVQADVVAKEAKGGEATDEGLERLNMLISQGVFPNAEHFMYWQGGNDLLDWMKKRDPFLLFSPNDPGYPFSDSLNNELDKIQSNIETAIGMAKAEGWQVYAATYAPLQPGIECPPVPWFGLSDVQADRANEYQALVNQRIRLAIQNCGAVLVDIGTDPDIPAPENYTNCNHLNSDGNAIVAERFFEVITSGP